MKSIVPQTPWTVKQKMKRRFRDCRSTDVRSLFDYLQLLEWTPSRELETILDVHNTTVYRVAERFRELGEASLWDGREDNGSAIVGIALSHFAKRVRLHFLPPCSPDHNRIERVWQDVPAPIRRSPRGLVVPFP